MKRKCNLGFLCLIPLGIIIGSIRRKYLNNMNDINGTPNMSGGFSFYAFSFLGFYLAIALLMLSYVAKSNMKKTMKGIIITIAIMISAPILFLTYFFL